MASLRRLMCLFVVVTSFWWSTCGGGEDGTVTVSLYYETMCPYCADFITNRLVKLFNNGLISIVKLRMVPWGNAFVQSDGSFACQHGPNECFLNTIEACSTTIYHHVERQFRFIHCVERLALENRLNEWLGCFQLGGLGRQIIDCYTSGYGNVIEQHFAAETAQLNPRHRFVPWIVVNNQPLQEDFENFESYICKAYTGTQVPEACRSLPIETNTLLKENHRSGVCFAHKTGNFTSSAIISPTSTHD